MTGSEFVARLAKIPPDWLQALANDDNRAERSMEMQCKTFEQIDWPQVLAIGERFSFFSPVGYLLFFSAEKLETEERDRFSSYCLCQSLAFLFQT